MTPLRALGRQQRSMPRGRGRGRARRLVLVLVLAALCSAAVGAQASASSVKANNYYESIMPQFMCVACHEPLELVSSPEAISEQATLLGFVDKGLTLTQIKAAMEAQYGPQVLAKPPAHGFNLVVYIIPPLVVIAGLLLLIYTLPKWRRRSREAAETKLRKSEPLEPDEARRLDAELDQFI